MPAMNAYQLRQDGGGIVIVTQTEFTYVPLPTVATSDTASPSPSASVTPHSSVATPTTTPTPSRSSTSVPDLSMIAKGPVNNDVFIAVLICLSLIATFYACVVGLVIWGKVKGSCPSCHRLEAKIKELESGRESKVTVDMVRARESKRQSDLEMEKTLANEAFGKREVSIWPTLLGKFSRKQKVPDEEEEIKVHAENEVLHDSLDWSAREQTFPSKYAAPDPVVNVQAPTPKHPRYEFESTSTSPTCQTPNPGVASSKYDQRTAGPSTRSTLYNLRRGYRDSNGDWQSFIEPYNGAVLPETNWQDYYSIATHPELTHHSVPFAPPPPMPPFTPAPMEQLDRNDPDFDRYLAARTMGQSNRPDAENSRQHADMLLYRMRERSEARKNGLPDPYAFEDMGSDEPVFSLKDKKKNGRGLLQGRE